MIVRFVVLGSPVPKGGLNARLTKTGKVGLFYPSRVKRAEQGVRAAAAAEMLQSSYPILGARVQVHARFYIEPTRSTGRLVGDVDKLARLVLDAMTGVVYEDDGLVVALVASKHPVEDGHVARTEVSVSIAV